MESLEVSDILAAAWEAARPALEAGIRAAVIAEIDRRAAVQQQQVRELKASLRDLLGATRRAEGLAFADTQAEPPNFPCQTQSAPSSQEENAAVCNQSSRKRNTAALSDGVKKSRVTPGLTVVRLPRRRSHSADSTEPASDKKGAGWMSKQKTKKDVTLTQHEKDTAAEAAVAAAAAVAAPASSVSKITTATVARQPVNHAATESGAVHRASARAALDRLRKDTAKLLQERHRTRPERAGRQAAAAYDCSQCEKFYDAAGIPRPASCRGENSHPHGPPPQSLASRHRFEQRPPVTPPGYWSLKSPPDNDTH